MYCVSKKIMGQTINLTPHAIKLNDGSEFKPTGQIARVTASFEEVGEGEYRQVFGDVQNLPASEEGVRYIVSGLVFAATDRKDVVAPATGHPDTIRNEKGHIMSVPGFVVNS